MGIKRNKSRKTFSYLYEIFFPFLNSFDEYFELIPAG
jgi:hypothetical protein